MLPRIFSYDTETGRVGTGDEDVRTVLIQICSKDAKSKRHVQLFMGEDCFAQFFGLFENSFSYSKYECFTFNLKYEFQWLLPWLREHYRWQLRPRNEQGKLGPMEPGTWYCVEDAMTVYSVEVCSRGGIVMRFRDDLRRGPPVPMKIAAKNVMREYPEWWEGTEVKGQVDDLYNDWWTLPYGSYGWRKFMDYAILDAYSQAMICRYYYDIMGNRKLTLNSYSLDRAIVMTYDETNVFFAMRRFLKEFPPLNREMQDIVEENMLGGYVHGCVGDWYGTFVHVDYSSSYPYEYVYGRLFKGRKIQRGQWKLLERKDFVNWVIVSFDFKLKKTGLPLICYGETAGQWYNTKGMARSLKMKEGHVEKKLMTQTYWEELQCHFNITNVKMHDVWSAPEQRGRFAKFIRDCYTNKQRPELKGTMQRDMYKRQMNAGIHGKTITKTHRIEVSYPDGVKVIERVINEPKLCALIGFTAMMNARERLARHCRILQEHGIKVMQCDTDSIVAMGTEKEVRDALGEDAFYKEGDMSTELGKFEFETFDGKTEFDHFRSWGLKRYCEIQNNVYRKSAFAGMHEDMQILLTVAPTDGTEFSWQQKKSKRLVDGEHTMGRLVYSGRMKAKAEDIWYHPPTEQYTKDVTQMALEKYIEMGWTEEMVWQFLQGKAVDIADRLRDKEVNEDMIAELEDDATKEKDKYWKRHARRAYEQKKLEEVKIWESDLMDTTR